MNTILGTHAGDPKKRTCKYYSTCKNWVSLWETDREGQDECKVCGAVSHWVIDDEK